MNTIGTLTNGHGAIVTIVKKTDGGYHLMPNHKPATNEKNMDKPIQVYQSYEVTIKPEGATDENGLRTIRVKARNGYDAMERAAWATGRPVFNAVRIDQ